MSPSLNEQTAVAIFDAHPMAESAIRRLQKAGIDLQRLSIIGKDFQTEEHAMGFYTAGDRMKVWAGQGAIWGSLWGMLFGGAFFFIPLIGPITVLGPLAVWFVSAVEGAVVGSAVGVLGAALASVGISEDSVVRYETAIKTGQFLVVVNGPAEMIAAARTVLGHSRATQVEVFEAGRAMNSTPTVGAAMLRAEVIGLMSDEEIARVSVTEGGPKLDVGEEYVDLQRLTAGVQRMNGDSHQNESWLARRSVHADTWARIVQQTRDPQSGPAILHS